MMLSVRPCGDTLVVAESELSTDDDPTDSASMIKKVLSCKLFPDDTAGAWKRSVKDIDGEILCGESFESPGAQTSLAVHATRKRRQGIKAW